MKRDELEKAAAAFILTRDAENNNEWWGTPQARTTYELKEFIDFTFPSVVDARIQELETELAKLRAERAGL